MNPGPEESARTRELLPLAAQGDPEAMGELLALHRERLSRMVRLRMDPRLRRRLDASDVMQEVSLEAAGRLADYWKDPPAPFFLWLRFLTAQRLAGLRRFHLGAKARDARREVAFPGSGAPGSTTEGMALEISAGLTSPGTAAERCERESLVRTTLEKMDPLDREVLSLRHFESLTNAEAAAELGISSEAASRRYYRALRRLRGLLGEAFLE